MSSWVGRTEAAYEEVVKAYDAGLASHARAGAVAANIGRTGARPMHDEARPRYDGPRSDDLDSSQTSRGAMEHAILPTRGTLEVKGGAMHPAPHITGKTRLYGLVGDPLAKAKSPELLNRLFIEQGVDAVCVPFGVKADDLSAFVTGARTMRNLSGVLVTMPHKQQMLAFVDELHPTARQVGALNVIRCHDDGRWVGAMFDGLGCVLGMQWEDCGPANKSVLLVGAGGAGRAIAFAVASAGARTLTIFDVDERRADDLAKSVAAATGCRTHFGAPDPREYEIVINATALGMNPDDPTPVNPDRLEPGSIVVDIINAPEPTPLCRAALARGCRTQDGRPMHEGQAVHTLRFLGFDYLPEGRSAPDTRLRSEPPQDVL